MQYTIRQITTKTILQKSALPDADWVVNPYTGCRFGCKYCYAAFVGRFTHPNEPWGWYVDVKINAPQLLRKELSAKLKHTKTKDVGSIFMSSVTDPYQGLEAKYTLTRRCLHVLIDLDYRGKVGILTKSHLVLRDMDLFKQLKNVEVGLTVTSTGDPISKYLETFASPHEARLETLKKLHDEGISTYAFVGPLLPHFVFEKENLEALLRAIKKTGVRYIYLEHINLSPTIADRLFHDLRKDHPELIKQFQAARSHKYREKLDELLAHLTQTIGLPIAHQQAIYHQDTKSWEKLK